MKQFDFWEGLFTTIIVGIVVVGIVVTFVSYWYLHQ